MRRMIAGAMTLGLLAAGLLAIPAGAVDTGTDRAWSEPMNHEVYWEAYFGADCTKYESHSGVIPAGYEAVVVHDGQWVRVYYPVSGAFTALGPFNYNTPNPDDHFAGPHSWVMKCNIETTEETTSTVMETTTTTADSTTSSTAGTTTTISEGTTTSSTPGLLVASWSASATCDQIAAEWGEGIVSVDLYQLVAGVTLGPDDGIVPFTVSGQTLDTSDALPSEWILVPVVEDGYTATPDQISLTSGDCENTTTSIDPTGSTLPFTGYSRMTIVVLAAVAAVSGILGYVLVMSSRED